MELSQLSNLEKRYEDTEQQVTMLKGHISEMELQLQASLAATFNRSFMWRIPDLAKHKRDAIDGQITSLYSPPFYTAKNGYKMCIRIYLNGDGMGHKTHLSIFFVLMKGGRYQPRCEGNCSSGPPHPS
jgi:TNF receptor-associated factor 2/TNF receptor-associated factor 3